MSAPVPFSRAFKNHRVEWTWKSQNLHVYPENHKVAGSFSSHQGSNFTTSILKMATLKNISFSPV